MTSGHALPRLPERVRGAARHGEPRRHWSIRSVINVWVIVFGLTALAVAAGLVRTAGLLQQATDDVIGDTATMTYADEIELRLLGYQRLSLLHPDDPTAGGARTQIAVATLSHLERLRRLAETERERALLDRIEAEITAYWSARQHLEARRFDPLAIHGAVQPLIDRAIASVEELRALNEADVRAAHHESLRVGRLSSAAAATAAVMLLAGLLLVQLGARRYIIAPLLGLHDTIRRFRAGDRSARAVPAGSRETSELAAALNEMIEALAQQREVRLAFTAGVAHDLRNPLSAVRMTLDLAKLDPSEASRSRALEVVDRQVGRLARMVDDLLEATKIEAGKLELHPEHIDLRDAAREIVHLYEPTAPEHQLVLHLPDEPVPIDADPLRIEQVASNLVSNAVKYSPAGGRVDVEVCAAAGEAILEVRDQGVGIDEEHMGELFAPFRRLSTGVAPGAGLGLSIVRRIVEAHGGRIEVESVVGRGSTFRVRLPRAASTDA